MSDEHDSASPVEERASTDLAAVAAGSVKGKFSRFKGGIGATSTDLVPAEHVLSDAEATVTLPTVNGKTVGRWHDGALWLPKAQLRMAPADELLCSRYQPGEADPDFERRKAALAALGDAIPALPITLSNQDVIIRGEAQPLFLVLDRPEIYFAFLELPRVEAKVELIRSSRQGSVVLRALSDEGPLRVKPSILEICHAVRYLRDCGYTYPEIAMHMAKNAEDNSRPSDEALRSYAEVDRLPESVKDLLHRGLLLFTHAKSIAMKFLGDDVLCAQLALLAYQHGKMTTREFDRMIGRVESGASTVQVTDGVIQEVERGTLRLMSQQPPPSQPTAQMYTGLMAAKPLLIQQETTRHQIQVLPHERAITPASWDGLRDYIDAITTNTPIDEAELRVMGFLQAIKEAALRQGILTPQGVLAPVVEANKRGHGSTG